MYIYIYIYIYIHTITKRIFVVITALEYSMGRAYINKKINDKQRVRNYSTFNATSSFMCFKQSSGIYLVS